MTEQNFVAKASISINASPAEVWKALTDPALIKEYMMGTTVSATWEEGSDITWSGEFKGKKFEDKGKVLQAKPGKVLEYTHYTPQAGEATASSMHTVTIELSGDENETKVRLSQDNNSTEQAKEESEKNWDAMLGGMKKLLEA